MFSQTSETRQRVIDAVRCALLTTVTITSDSSNVEAWDSVGHLQVMIELEREFNVRFPTDQILKNQSVEELCTLVSRTLSND